MKQRLQKILFFNSFILVQLCILSGLIVKNDHRCQNNTTHLCNKQDNDLKSNISFNTNKESNSPIIFLFSLLNIVAYLSLQKNIDKNLIKNILFNQQLVFIIKKSYSLIIKKIFQKNFYLQSYLSRHYCLYEYHYKSNFYFSYN